MTTIYLEMPPRSQWEQWELIHSSYLHLKEKVLDSDRSEADLPEVEQIATELLEVARFRGLPEGGDPGTPKDDE